MKNILPALLASVLCSLVVPTPTARAQGTALTYQGRLHDAAGPASGTYNFQFTVRDALTGGSAVGVNPLAATLVVSNGLFTATLDPGAGVFTGANRWLEIAVRTNGAALFTTLSPRQKLTAAPYAIMAGTATSATSLASPPGMVLIPAGSFTMGDTLDGLGDAVPISTTVSAFYLDVNEVTWSQWQSVYYWATNRGYGFVYAGAGKAANHPVQFVDWYDTVKWCNARSQQAGRTPVYYTDAGLTQVYTNGEPATLYPNWSAKGYRLPTEAEWEKAARGGLSGQRFPWGNVINQNLANYYADTASYSYDLGPNGYHPIGNYPTTSPGTSPVGSFAANGYGLYDMAGNVYEWCWDWYGTYAGGTDPRGPASGSFRVIRGGSCHYGAFNCRSAYRDYGGPGLRGNIIGFRSVLPSGQ